MNTLQYLKEATGEKKTAAAKKNFLTRSRREFVEYYNDLKNAYEKRGKNPHGWFLGKKIFKIDVNNAERDVKILDKFRKEIF
jgi:hypothetical protein